MGAIKSFIGKVMDWVNTTGAKIVSGSIVVVGGRAFPAIGDILVNETGTLATEEVFAVDKATGRAWTPGLAIYYDPAAGKATDLAAPGNALLGMAFAPASADATTGLVKLGVAPVAAADGLLLATAVFDATAGKAVGTYGLGVTLPSGAIITRAFYKVGTTFVSAGADAGTIALQSEAAGDLVTAVAISDAGNPWDAGLHEAKADGTAAKMVALTADRELKAVVAGQALTAGKMTLFVTYVQA